MTDTDFVGTRRALHAVAELVLAGPQYRASGSIRLQVSPGGFRTTSEPDLRVAGVTVVASDRHVPISSATARSIAAAVGVEAGAPEDVYREGSGMSVDEELIIDPTAADRIADAYQVGDAALRLLAPEAEPVLWPEHFDVGVRIGDINYGVSPGDGYLGEPYAYVGVDPVPADSFWNAPFGATRPMTNFTDAQGLREFFLDGRDRVGSSLHRPSD